MITELLLSNHENNKSKNIKKQQLRDNWKLWILEKIIDPALAGPEDKKEEITVKTGFEIITHRLDFSEPPLKISGDVDRYNHRDSNKLWNAKKNIST